MAKSLIAVVNNDTVFLEMMEELLREEGYEVIIWKVGETAFDMLRKKKPDLVILDVRMEQPEAGWQLLEVLTLDPTTREIPVIICSADERALAAKEEHLRKHGIETLQKPFDINDLLAAISRALPEAAY